MLPYILCLMFAKPTPADRYAEICAYGPPPMYHMLPLALTLFILIVFLNKPVPGYVPGFITEFVPHICFISSSKAGGTYFLFKLAYSYTRTGDWIAFHGLYS